MISKIKFLFLILISLKAHSFQEKKNFTANDFKKIHTIFEKRFDFFTQKKIKIKKPFRDTLFAIQHWALENGTRSEKLIADFQIFFVYNQLIDNEKIIDLGMQLIAKMDFLEMPESIYVAREVLSAYDRKGFYRKYLELYPLIKKLNAKHSYNKIGLLTEDYYRLAMVYYRLENYTKARENFQYQVKNLLKENKKFRAGSMYNNIGLTYEKQNEFDKAIEYYNKSLKLLNEDKKKDDFFTDDYKKHFKNVVASNIASINVKQLNLQGVEPIFLRELVSAKRENVPRIIIQAYLNLSEVHFLNKNFKKTAQFLDSSFLRLKSYESAPLLSRAYLLKAKYLLSLQKIKDAEFYFSKNIFLEDSLKKVKLEKGFQEASLQFNLKVIEEDLGSSKKLIEQQKETTLYQWITIGITSVAGVVFLLLFLRIRKNNKSIEQNKKELTKALKNNQTLLQEIHHRIKNNLQIISGILELKSSKLNDEKSVTVFLETQKYIESMSYIHEHLYAQDDKAVIKMDEYLNNLTHAVINNYSTKNITVSINAENIVMNTENATPLGLIICELLTNSAKHAFEKSGTIDIQLTKENNRIYFHYKDNGKGFSIDKKTASGQIGVNLMHMLIEELQADKKEFIDNGYHIKLQF